MLLTVNVGQVKAFLAHMLLHGWIHSQLFADGMASQGPSELVPPFSLVF